MDIKHKDVGTAHIEANVTRQVLLLSNSCLLAVAKQWYLCCHLCLNVGSSHKIFDIRRWKKHLFLGISSTNTENLVSSLYQCVKTGSVYTSISLPTIVSPPFQLLRYQPDVSHQDGFIAEQTDERHPCVSAN
jgi:hypothetical protein